jgi:hypothetical protein
MRRMVYPTSRSLPTTLVQVWCRSLWVCCHARDGVTKSHSQVVEWMSGSRIQSHCPCSTLCPISMFSRILATVSMPVPANQAGLCLANSSVARPASSRERCVAMTRRM